MNKSLKIGGIVLGVVIFLFIAAIFLEASRSMLSGSSSDFSRGDSMGLSGSSMGFSVPASTGVANSSRLQKSVNSESVSVQSSLPEANISDYADDPNNSAQTEKKIIKNGNLSLKVDSADKAAQKISEIAKNNGGEVFSSNFHQTASNVKSGTISIKIPVNNFENSFSEIKTVASLVINESTSGQDVTEQYIDLQAQLKNRQAEEKSFVKILDQAQKIQDILDVTAQLARVRGNIEQLQGRIKYLESQTDMSTISVNISEDQNITVVDSWRPFQVVKESLNSLVKNLQGFVDFLIRLVIIIIPLLAIWGIIVLIAYKIGKKIYLKIKNKNQAQ